MQGTPLPQSNAAPQGQQQARVNLNLSIDELNVIIMGLIKLPYETSAPVVDVVRGQATSQLQQTQQAQQGSGLEGGPQVSTVNLQ
jgi:hypothetical protein